MIDKNKRKDLIHLAVGIATITFSAVIGIYLAIVVTGWIGSFTKLVKGRWQ